MRATIAEKPYRPVANAFLATIALLLIPLAAMWFTDEVKWKPGDFLVAAVLLFAAGLGFQLIARNAIAQSYRWATGIAVFAVLLLVWVNLAVGMIGSENHTANLLYITVLATGAIGATIAGLRPRGMTRTLLAMAATHGLVAAIAVIADLDGARQEPLIFLSMNALFVALFLISAGLYLRSDRARD